MKMKVTDLNVGQRCFSVYTNISNSETIVRIWQYEVVAPEYNLVKFVWNGNLSDKTNQITDEVYLNEKEAWLAAGQQLEEDIKRISAVVSDCYNKAILEIEKAA
jgi:hypothetical protein